MAKPSRLPSVNQSRTYFITASTWQKRSLFQAEPLASLFLQTLFHYRERGFFKLHAYVLMRDHFHLLITTSSGTTLERAVQLIKGGFSYRVKAELGKSIEIWQRGFTDRRVRNQEEFASLVQYIRNNPVKALLAKTPEAYPYSSAKGSISLDPPPNHLSG